MSVPFSHASARQAPPCASSMRKSSGLSTSSAMPGSPVTMRASMPSARASALCGRKLSWPKWYGMASGGELATQLVPRPSPAGASVTEGAGPCAARTRSISAGETRGTSPGKASAAPAPAPASAAAASPTAGLWPRLAGSSSTAAPYSSASACAQASRVTTTVPSRPSAPDSAASTSSAITRNNFRRSSGVKAAARRVFACSGFLSGRTPQAEPAVTFLNKV